jgi:hypothetical protein
VDSTLGLTELSAVVALLRPEAWRMLARGPQPEPRCRICRTVAALARLERARGAEQDEDGRVSLPDHEHRAVTVLLDYHECVRERNVQLEEIDQVLTAAATASPRQTQRYAAALNVLTSEIVYTRCLLVYSVARSLVVARDAVAAHEELAQLRPDW